jgi:hypothetical protein
MFVTSKVLSTNPSATILSRTLIVNFKGMIVLLYCNIQDSFHESIYFNTVLESVEIISRKGQWALIPSLAT